MSRSTRAARGHAGPPVEPPARRGVWVELGIVLGIIAAWMAIAAAVSGGFPTIHFDTLRDMAYAQNILNGHLWRDPSLPGQPWWYPPANPLLVATVARLTGVSIVDLYPASMFWLNVLGPVMLYLLVRYVTGSRAIGLLALPMVGLGSYWWLTHSAAPLPGIQGVALNLGGLMLWHRAQRGGWPWLLAAGCAAGLATWYHPLCGMVLVLAIGLHGLSAIAWPAAAEPTADGGRFALLRRAVVVTGLGVALAAPLLLHVLMLPKRNLAPFQWFAPELHDPRHALHSHALLALPLGLLGAWALWRAKPAARWAVAYLLVALAGEAAGYLGHDLHWPIPYSLPHEFQWHEQLALGVCAAFGAGWLASTLAKSARVRIVILTGLAAVTIGPALRNLDAADDQLIHLNADWRSSLQAGAWIRAHLPFDAVVACNPDAAYAMAGLTGRKVVALPAGHMNPAVDAARRYGDLEIMLTTPDAQEFATVAARYRVTHLMALPPRAEMVPAVRATYAGWPNLQALDVGDSTVMMYRVGAGPGSRN